MSRPAFFVDGQTEQRALNKLCPGHPIRIIGCNGKNVSISSIAERLSSHIRLLNNRHYPIVVLIDREGREETFNQIEQKLKEQLILFDIKIEVLIGVCDRMIENWILADTKNIEEYTGKKIKLKETSFEGLAGKSILKKHYPEYHETTDGVILLSTSDPKRLYNNSVSFKSFAIEIQKLN